MRPVPPTSGPGARASIPRGERNVHPLPDSPEYRATALRHPTQPLIVMPQTLTELSGPVFGRHAIAPSDHDLTRQHTGEPVGQRIVVAGRVLDEGGRPVPDALIEDDSRDKRGRRATEGP
jgi:protocatechuate 3,4-dioxygenase beta subunit